MNGFLDVLVVNSFCPVLVFTVQASPVGLNVGLVVIDGLPGDGVVLSTRTLPLTTVVLYLSEFIGNLVVDVGNHNKCETVVESACTSGLKDVKNGIIVTLKCFTVLTSKDGLATVGFFVEGLRVVVLMKISGFVAVAFGEVDVVLFPVVEMVDFVV